MRPDGRAPRVDAKPDLAAHGRRLEGSDLDRDELRLARLLVVDTSLHDEDPVRLEVLARGGVRRVEDDDLGVAGRIVERDEDHRVAALRRHLLERRDDPAHDHDLSVAPALDLGERAVGLPLELSRDPLEGMLGHVQPERLLLEAEELPLVVLHRRDRRIVALLLPPRSRRNRRRSTPGPRAGRLRTAARARAQRRGCRGARRASRDASRRSSRAHRT